MMKFLILAAVCIGSSLAIIGDDPYMFKCSAAMVCVDLSVCDKYGVIAKSAISLTEDEKLNQHPLLPCKKSDGGKGVCCRDPDYTDPWPAGPPVVTRISIPSTTTTRKTTTTTRPTTTTTRRTTTTEKPCPPPKRKNKAGKCIDPPTDVFESESSGCSRRNRTAVPDKNLQDPFKVDTEAGAGEFPWMSGIYANDEFKCTCYLAKGGTCITSASCVKDYKPSDLEVLVGLYDIEEPNSVKEPSWDGSRESPKPPQYLPVRSIAFDPDYSSKTNQHDVAIVHLGKDVKVNHYTKAICFDNYNAIPLEKYEDCTLSGWKEDKSNLPHWTDLTLLPMDDCKKQLPDFNAKVESCARPKSNVCDLVSPGASVQCRETGVANKPSPDVYLLKGVYSANNGCSQGQLIRFSHITFPWFGEALTDPNKHNKIKGSSNDPSKHNKEALHDPSKHNKIIG